MEGQQEREDRLHAKRDFQQEAPKLHGEGTISQDNFKRGRPYTR